MKVAVRVDASRLIGTGHVRRMIALAHVLGTVGAEVRFLWRDLGLDVAAMMPHADWALPPIGQPVIDFDPAPDMPRHAAWAGVAMERDAAETLAALRDFAPDWVVVDHYAFDARWHDRVRRQTKARLAVIDDLADRPISADLIVDHNYHPDHQAKFGPANLRGCPLLGGPDYALIGALYAKAPRYRFREHIQSIGIFTGGIDLVNASGMAIDAIRRAGLTCAIEVVSTSANPNLEQLKRKAQLEQPARVSVDLPNLADFFARHDLQIGAGGGALWERFCIGAPTLAIICAENQRESVPLLDALGAVAMSDALGSYEAGVDSIVAALKRLSAHPDERRKLGDRAIALVDGKGPERIGNCMMEIDRGHSA